MPSKNISYSESISNRLAKIVTKLEIKASKSITQEEVVLRYLNEGLKRDEKKLKQIKI